MRRIIFSLVITLCLLSTFIASGVIGGAVAYASSNSHSSKTFPRLNGSATVKPQNITLLCGKNWVQSRDASWAWTVTGNSQENQANCHNVRWNNPLTGLRYCQVNFEVPPTSQTYGKPDALVFVGFFDKNNQSFGTATISESNITGPTYINLGDTSGLDHLYVSDSGSPGGYTMGVGRVQFNCHS